MRTIRASELGSYLYCRRAWHYQNEGFTSENQTELADGVEYHRRQGKKIVAARLLRAAGWLFLVLALVALAVAITMQAIG